MSTTIRYTPNNGLRRLRILLPHLIDHAKAHGREFAAFRELLQAACTPEQIVLFEVAAQQMDLTSQALQRLQDGVAEPATPQRV